MCPSGSFRARWFLAQAGKQRMSCSFRRMTRRTNPFTSLRRVKRHAHRQIHSAACLFFQSNAYRPALIISDEKMDSASVLDFLP